MKTTILTTLLLFVFSIMTFGQAKVIELENPSFEDYPRAERVPHGWTDCGFRGESPPDTHPSGAFDVVKYPAEGNTYLGMVVRDNDTWESVSQKLASPLIGGKCYALEISLCRSETYVSASRRSNQKVNYTDPISLVIWGGNSECNKGERLATTKGIVNTDWAGYNLTLQPSQNFEYLLLEAFYIEPVLKPYNGNILLDNASSLVPVTCDSIVESPTFTKPKAIYYNSTLSDLEKELAIKEIIEQTKDFPKYPVTIIIEENNKKLRKSQKEMLIQQLNEMEISKDSYEIYLYDK